MSQIALVALPSHSSPPDARLLAMASDNED